MRNFYVLDGKIAKQCTSTLEWGRWMEENDRKVAHDEIDGVVISTVFLGIDHNFFGEGDPLLFETMTFLPDDWGGIEQWRYFTWEEAETGHRKIVEKVRRKMVESGLRASAVLAGIRGNHTDS